MSSSYLRTPSEADVRRAASTYVPRRALIFHAAHSESQFADNDRPQSVVTTVHDIDMRKGVPQLGPGEWLTRADERQIVDLLQGRERRANAFTLLPPNLLHADVDSLTWFAPARRRPMHFRWQGFEGQIDVVWPSLILRVVARRLYVVALAANERPSSLDAALFHAPLGNIHADTSMCFGDVRMPREASPATIAEWEACLFDTAFTHINHQAVLGNSRRVDNAKLLSYWRARHGKTTDVREADLKPLGLTLRQWLEGTSAFAEERD